jgi:hypothetical protein
MDYERSTPLNEPARNIMSMNPTLLDVMGAAKALLRFCGS